jgi:two-component system, OmpR family, copper resistance phosphate regulon response regulator CusR
MRLLIIEDDKLAAESLREAMRRDYAVDLAFNAKQAEELANSNEYDLLMIDYNLPDGDGMTLAQKLRAQEITAPFLMVTGRSGIDDKVTALDAGVDDYITKPFQIDELLARVRALLRRQHKAFEPNTLKIADLELNISARSVTRGEQKINLRRKEFQLLEFLMRNKGRTVTRDLILEHVWDNSSDPTTNIVDVHMKYLRDKIDKGHAQKLIHTIYGLGYKIEA